MTEDQVKTEKEQLISQTGAMEGVKPTLTPQNIRPEQVGRIAGKLYPPSQKTSDVSKWVNAKKFLLRRDFAPDDVAGRRYSDRKVGELHNEGLKRDPGVTERFTRLVASAKTEEETAKVNQEQEQKLAEDIAERFKQKQEEQFYPPVVAPSQTPPPPRPFTPAPVSRPPEENLRQQVSQTPAVAEQKGGIGGFFRRLFNR